MVVCTQCDVIPLVSAPLAAYLASSARCPLRCARLDATLRSADGPFLPSLRRLRTLPPPRVARFAARGSTPRYPPLKILPKFALYFTGSGLQDIHLLCCVADWISLSF
jgi:hypothetical protein